MTSQWGLQGTSMLEVQHARLQPVYHQQVPQQVSPQPAMPYMVGNNQTLGQSVGMQVSGQLGSSQASGIVLMDRLPGSGGQSAHDADSMGLIVLQPPALSAALQA